MEKQVFFFSVIIQPPFYLKGGWGDFTKGLKIPLGPPFSKGEIRRSPWKRGIFKKMLSKEISFLDKTGVPNR
jgi:hypothetical protein